MFTVKVENVSGCEALFKAEHNWGMGELIGALVKSFGEVRITVAEEDDDSQKEQPKEQPEDEGD